MIHVRSLAVLALSVAPTLAARADGDIEWRHRATQAAVTLTANPLGNAAQTAFYTARGFTEATIRPYAQACGFSFGMQNGGKTTLTTRIAEWHAIGADGTRIAVRLPQAWDVEWANAGVATAARIAFRWAQFQAENTFEPGDWIMGMATLTATPSGPLRLIAKYHDDKGSHEIHLDKLVCTRD